MPILPPGDLLLIAPELFLSAAGMAILIYATMIGRAQERALALVSVGSLALTGLLLFVSRRGAGFGGMLEVDRFALYFKGLVILAAIITILFSLRFVEVAPYPGGEYYALILLTTVGMMFMASGTHFGSIYISLELMALSQYVLAGYFKKETKSIEAAAKYFILGAFSSAVLLYGISLVYGATGTLSLSGMAASAAMGERSPLLIVGIILVACGLLFKVASAPFHVWAPDVYEGAPTPISAFFAVGPKLAAYAILARIFFVGFGPRVVDWAPIIAASAALTMVVGNVGALMQTNVKRMLGYSSIGHAGYALLGVLGYSTSITQPDGKVVNLGLSSILIYLLAYALMNLGVFGLVVLLESKGYAAESIDDFNGLSKKNPIAAAVMIVFLLSLAGIPPTAGFIGKYYLFTTAMKSGWVGLTLLAVLMSAVSLFYYFRIARAMYLVDGEGELKWREEPAVAAAVFVCVTGTLMMGILPQPFIRFAESCLLK